jgi:two-component system CheB/CheR fusion protein
MEETAPWFRNIPSATADWRASARSSDARNEGIVARKKPRGAKRRRARPAQASGRPAAPRDGFDRAGASAPASPQPAATPLRDGFPVVGVGASAGGLEVFSELLKNLPPDVPMAIVLVQHLDPKHRSLLSEILTRTTPMPVVEVHPGMRVEPAHVYVIPPDTTMTIVSGVLQLSQRRPTPVPHMPVDTFLQSLADDLRERSIGVVLSGSASDGALGLKAIKGEGGVTFAQDPATAAYDGMPRSAIASGAVDFVLSPRAIAQELTRIGRHPYLRDPAAPAVEAEPTDERALGQIYRILQQETGVDFRLYRQTTIRRRIARRMLVHRIDTIERYRRVLDDNPDEVQVLYNELLINVTRFFRDPDAFGALQQAVVSRLGRQRAHDQTLRVWVPGCATGEEAYSLAIALLEALEGAGLKAPVQLFGTDVSDAAVARARAGVYPSNIELDVSPERLRRFFTKLEGQYQVKKSLRELCIFARHNLTKDAPFSSVDVVSCRNVLIYLDASLQRRIMGTFHYALRGTGVLMLGGSETVGPLSDLFTLLDKRHKIYGKKPTSSHTPPGTTTFDRPREERERQRAVVPRSDEGLPRVDLQREVDGILLRRYAPAGVLINEAYEILQFRGHTSAYLEPAAGQASLNLMKMARQGLLMELRGAILSARKRHAAVRREGVRVKQNGGLLTVNVEVIPVRGPADERNYLVLFENVRATRAKTPAALRPAPKSAYEQEIDRLGHELTATKEFLQSIVEEREAANEELRSTNEEMQSSNEELQSTNEELETAKEELQSVNEELTTVNEELEHRNAELGVLNNDLNNLIIGVNIPVVILGSDLRIRRFSPMAAKAFNLVPADIGRPLAAIRGNVEVPDLEQTCAQVIETAAPAVLEVRDRDGGWHSLRVRPYRTADNVVEGAVLTLLDISAIKTSLEQVAAARDAAEAIIDTGRTPLLILDSDFLVHSANRAFYETFQVTAEQTVNRRVFDLGGGEWNLPALHRVLDELVERGASFDDFEVEREFPSIGTRVILLGARRLRRESGPVGTILLALEDITSRRQAERELHASAEVRYRRLFETTKDGIILVDADTGQITNVNPFWVSLTGLPPGEFLGRKLWEIRSFQDRATVRALIDALREQDFRRDDDVRVTAADGRRRHVELACNVYPLGGKRVIQCIARDITERIELLERERAARAAAEAANRAKDDFLSVLSHELRTPLTAMLGWVRVLRRGAIDPTKTADALETVERNTRLLAQLIEDLLDVSRIAAGKLSIEMRSVDLGTVVREAVETVRESADAKGVRLDVHAPPVTPTVRGDRHRLRQVIWNLLSNAVKFTPQGGHIDARLEGMPAGARITVSDTGRGISPQFLPQIFDRFRQAETVSTRTQGGLGLGLAIVRHLVELHGGRVAVFSAGEGRGATFTIDLPQGTAGHAAEEEPLAPPAPPVDPRLDGLRVLIVENEADTGRMLAQILNDRGADVIHVETAAAALAALEQRAVHLIVSDIGMPDGDGYELIRRVRSLAVDGGGRIPAIALTAFAREEDMHRALEAGFDVHIAKPIDPAELVRVVSRIAHSR